MSIILKSGKKIGKSVKSLKKINEIGMMIFLDSSTIEDYKEKEYNGRRIINIEVSYSEARYKELIKLVNKIKSNALYNISKPKNQIESKFKKVEI